MNDKRWVRFTDRFGDIHVIDSRCVKSLDAADMVTIIMDDGCEYQVLFELEEVCRLLEIVYRV